MTRLSRATCAALLAAHAMLLGACADPTAPTPLAPDDAPLAAAAGAKPKRVRLSAPDITWPSFSVPLGSRPRVHARVVDAKGRTIPGRRVTLTTADPDVATIDAAGVITTHAPGHVVVTGVHGTLRTSFGFSVRDTAAPPDTGGEEPEPPPTGSAPPEASVSLTVRRFARGGGASVLVSNGIPLRPGMLRRGQERWVRVVLGDGAGEEQAIHVAPLAGTHRDGSLRALLVQFPLRMGAGQRLPGRLLVGAPRAAAMTLPGRVAAPVAQPDAAALPDDPRYLVATDLVGPTRTAEATAAMGGAYGAYDRAFQRSAERRWAEDSSAWVDNYYDRALIYDAMWVRTGDPTYWRRGVEHARRYRAGYLAPNDYKPSPHWSQLEGVEKHYLLTGDETSRTAVARVAESLWRQVRRKGLDAWDQRIAARVIHAQLLAWRLNGAAGYRPTAPPASWTGRMDDAVGQLARWQRADGRYDTGRYWCHGQPNFMVGMLNEALADVHTYYRQDPRAVTLVRRSADYLWRTQWLDGADAFRYLSVRCAGRGTTHAAGDLNGLMVASYGWLYRQTGDARYRAQGEQVFAGLVRHWNLGASKQFNQAFATSWRYLARD